jgi:hypothetical protein
VFILHDLPPTHIRPHYGIETRRVAVFSVFADPIKIYEENSIAFMQVEDIQLPEVTKDKILSVEQPEGLLKALADDFDLQQTWGGKRRKEEVKRAGVRHVLHHDHIHVTNNAVARE